MDWQRQSKKLNDFLIAYLPKAFKSRFKKEMCSPCKISKEPWLPVIDQSKASYRAHSL